MSSIYKLAIRHQERTLLEQSHHGDGYGEGALILPFTHEDLVIDETDPDYPTMKLSTSVAIAVDRLACLGLGLPHCLSVLESCAHEPGTEYQPALVADLNGSILDALRTEVNQPFVREAKRSPRASIASRIIEGSFKNPQFIPFGHGLPVLLSVLPPEATFELDLSDTDWIDHEGFLIDVFPIESTSFSPAAILCEGIFDSQVLQFALDTTHPYLRSFLKIPDFDFNREGGASALAKLAKGLADAGIRHPGFVAMFDADLSGANEAARLMSTGLPANSSVITLPRSSELEQYPVILPDGTRTLNVNGWGAAIELYLSCDLGLKPPLLLSYQYGAAAGYQGTMAKEDKKAVQDKFREVSASGQDWPALNSIIEHIVRAVPKASVFDN